MNPLHPVASGRLVTSEIQIVQSPFDRRPTGVWWWLKARRIEAEVIDGTQVVATLESGYVRTRDVRKATKLRRTSVDLTTGERWDIATEPDPSTTSRRRSTGVVTVVRDDDRVLAVAREPSLDVAREGARRRKEARHRRGDTLVRRVGRAADAAFRSVRSELGVREHRRGAGRWLFAGAIAAGAAAALAITAIVTGVVAGVGLATGFGATAVVLALVAWASLRRWRDRRACWLCGATVEGRPATCPSCGAPRPATSGTMQRARSVNESVATTFARRGSVPTRLLPSAIEISYGGGARAWAGRRAEGWVVDGVLTMGSVRRGTVTVVPVDDVPLEVVLLVWHKLVVDVVRPAAG